MLLPIFSNLLLISILFLGNQVVGANQEDISNKFSWIAGKNDTVTLIQSALSNDDTIVTAVNTESNDDPFLRYQNPTIGIKIQYPPNFEITEMGKSFVAFHTPLEGDEQIYSEQFGIFIVDEGPMDSTDSSADGDDNDLLEQVNRHINTYTDNILVEGPTDVSISGNPAKKAIFRNMMDSRMLMEIWTKDPSNDNIIQFEVSVPEEKYSQFPPDHLQQMLDSIELINASSGIGNGSSNGGENATISGSNITDTGILINQNQTVLPTPSFVNYQNNTHGVQIQYPSNWEKQEGIGEVIFLSPLESNADTFREGLAIIIQPSEDISLDNFVNNTVNSLRRAAVDLQVVNSYPTNFANSIPAHRVEYTWTNPQNNIKTKTMEIYTITDGKGYIFSYGAPLEKYDLYLPTVQSMISSLIL